MEPNGVSVLYSESTIYFCTRVPIQHLRSSAVVQEIDA